MLDNIDVSSEVISVLEYIADKVDQPLAHILQVFTQQAYYEGIVSIIGWIVWGVFVCFRKLFYVWDVVWCVVLVLVVGFVSILWSGLVVVWNEW